MHGAQYWDIYSHRTFGAGVAGFCLQDALQDVQAGGNNSPQIYSDVLSWLQAVNYRFQLCAMDCSIDNQLRTSTPTTIAYLIMHLFKGRASALSFSFRKHLDIVYRAFTSRVFYAIKTEVRSQKTVIRIKNQVQCF